jgi:hypothetical protein
MIIERRQSSIHGLLVSILALWMSVGISCRATAPSIGQSPYDFITIEQEQIWTALGRKFFLSLESIPPPPGVSGQQHTLKITGDCPHIELTYPGQPPNLQVLADKIIFSGHAFEVTQDPGRYRLDGTDYQLGPSRNVYVIFVDSHLVSVMSI